MAVIPDARGSLQRLSGNATWDEQGAAGDGARPPEEARIAVSPEESDEDGDTRDPGESQPLEMRAGLRGPDDTRDPGDAECPDTDDSPE